MSEPTDQDREEAARFLQRFKGERLFQLDVADVADLIASARSAGSLEMKEKAAQRAALWSYPISDRIRALK